MSPQDRIKARAAIMRDAASDAAAEYVSKGQNELAAKIAAVFSEIPDESLSRLYRFVTGD